MDFKHSCLQGKSYAPTGNISISLSTADSNLSPMFSADKGYYTYTLWFDSIDSVMPMIDILSDGGWGGRPHPEGNGNGALWSIPEMQLMIG